MVKDETIICLRLRTKQEWLSSPQPFNIVVEVLTAAVRHEKETIRHSMERKIKLYLFSKNMIIYAENPRECPKIIC